MNSTLVHDRAKRLAGGLGADRNACLLIEREMRSLGASVELLSDMAHATVIESIEKAHYDKCVDIRMKYLMIGLTFMGVYCFILSAVAT